MSYFTQVLVVGAVAVIILLVGQLLVDKTVSHLVSSCRQIGEPGSYVLSSGLRGANVSVPDILNSSTFACISVISSDVVFDCRNNSIIDGLEGNMTIGIMAANVSNVTVRNCVIANYWSGIYYYGATGGNISGNILLGNIHDGIGLLQTNDTLVENNLVTFSVDNGIGISHGWNDTIIGNSGYQDYQVVDCSPCFDSLIADNVGRGVGELVYIENSTGVTDRNNTVIE